MKKVIRENILTAYSLHDMNIISVDIVGNDIILRTQSGLVETVFPYGQPTDMWNFKMSGGITVLFICLVLQEMLVHLQAKKCF